MGINTKPATGARAQIACGEETVYGESVPPTHLIGFTSESLSATETSIQSEEIRSDRGYHQFIRGSLEIAGDISVELNTSGLGILIRHTLGDYIKVNSVDGGVHARIAEDAPLSNGNKSIYRLADDAPVLFDAGAEVKFVYRDVNEALAESTAATVIETSCLREATYSVDQTQAADSLTVAGIPDGAGGFDPLSCDPNGGLVRHKGVIYPYDDYNSTTNVFSFPAGSLPADTVLEGDGIEVLPCLVVASGPVVPEAVIGSWVYQYSADYVGVFTHHIERGKELPVGLSIEVDRDAAIFVYRGMKVSTMALTFDAQAVLAGTFSFVGKGEDAIAALMAPAKPADSSILVDRIGALKVTGGRLTIGEETNITYTGYTGPDANGNYTVSGIPTSGENSIQRYHEVDENVDGRTSRAEGDLQESSNSPLSSFEANVYLNGYWEEVLSAAINVNNEQSTDKYGLGSREPFAVIEGRTTVDGNLNMEFDDGKHYKKFIDGNEFSVRIACISEADDSEIGETGVLSQIYFFMPRCRFTGTTPNVSDTNFIQHDMPFTAIVDDPLKTTDIICIIVNREESDVEIT